MKRSNMIITAFAAAIALSGCSLSDHLSETRSDRMDRETEAPEVLTEGTVAPSVSVSSEDDVPVYQSDKLKGIYAADDQNIYFASGNVIYRLNRQDGRMGVLAKLSDDREKKSNFEMVRNFYREGDYLYYKYELPASGKNEDQQSLWKIHTRNGTVERLDLPPSLLNCSSFFVADQQFYFQYWDNADGSRTEKCAVYEMNEMGNPGDETTDTEKNAYLSMPEGCKDAYVSMFCGTLPLPYQMAHYSKCVLEEASTGNYILYDAGTGEKETLFSTAKELCFYDGEHLLYAQYHYDTDVEVKKIYLYLISTGDTMELDVETPCGADLDGFYYFKKQEDQNGVYKAEIYRLTFDDVRSDFRGKCLFSFDENDLKKDGLGIIQRSFLALDHGEIYFVNGDAGQPEKITH